MYMAVSMYICGDREHGVHHVPGLALSLLVNLAIRAWAAVLRRASGDHTWAGIMDYSVLRVYVLSMFPTPMCMTYFSQCQAPWASFLEEAVDVRTKDEADRY